MSIRDANAVDLLTPSVMAGNEVRSMTMKRNVVPMGREAHALMKISADDCERPVEMIVVGLCLASCRTVSLPRPLIPPITRMVLPSKSGISFLGSNFMARD